MALSIQELWQDIRGAGRGLLRAPRFAASSIVLLALGMAAVTALFGVVYLLILRPLPFPQAKRLVEVGAPVYNVYNRDLQNRKSLTPIFTHIAAYSQADDLLRSAGGAPEVVAVAGVTQEFFQVMGVPPRLGTGMSAGTRVAVVSDQFWRARLGAADDAVGTTIVLGGVDYRVTGVMPPGFSFPRGVAAWVPLSSGEGGGSEGSSVVVVGRLRPGLSLRQARAGLRTVTTYATQPGVRPRTGAAITPLRDFLLGGQRRLVWSLAAAAVLFLLLACAGVANLALARRAGRQSEFAIRMALGAKPSRLGRELFAGNLILALIGSLVGWVAAAVAIGLVLRLSPSLVAGASGSLRLAAITGAFAAALAVATALFCSAMEWAWAPARTPFVHLKDSGSGTGVRLPTELLLGAQLALALVLLIGTGLLARSLAGELAVNLGFKARGVYTVSVSFPLTPAEVALRQHPALRSQPGRRLPPQVLAQMAAAGRAAELLHVKYYREAERQLAALPGVAEVGSLSPVPFSGNSAKFTSFKRDPRLGAPGKFVGVYVRSTDAAGLAALGIPLVSGRGFASTTGAAAPLQAGGSARGGRDAAQVPVLINRKLAEDDWPGGNAVGQHLWEASLGGMVEVAGVVGNIREAGARLGPVPTIYYRTVQEPGRRLSLVVRLRPGYTDAAFVPAARAALAALPFSASRPAVASLESSAERGTSQVRLALLLLACFAALGVIVAALGVFANANQLAVRRRREIGVRMALGADAPAILRLMLRRSARILVLALPLGALAAYGLARALAHLLFGVGATDPATYIAACLLLGVIAILAALRPSSRAARQDPAATLRNE